MHKRFHTARNDDCNENSHIISKAQVLYGETYVLLLRMLVNVQASHVFLAKYAIFVEYYAVGSLQYTFDSHAIIMNKNNVLNIKEQHVERNSL